MSLLPRAFLLVALLTGLLLLLLPSAASAADCWGTEPPPGPPTTGDDFASSIRGDAPVEGSPADMILEFFCHWETRDPADFTVSIDWGDGQTGPGTVHYAGGSAGSSSDPGYQLYVRATHTYARTGRPVAVATVRSKRDGSERMLRHTFDVRNAFIEPLMPFAPVVTAMVTPSTHRLAGFRDGNPLGAADDYTAAVDWGDGTTGAGVVTKEADGTLVVSGTHAFTAPGVTVGNVVLRDGDGESASSSVTFLGPPISTSPPGVVIDGGARFTRSRDVRLRLGWPAGARGMLVSGDAGFGGAALSPLAAEVPWRLTAPSGRAPATVHVRFGHTGPTFSDGIVLDDAAPALRRLSASRPRGAGAVSVRLQATDAVSGVDRVEVAESRRGGRLLKPARVVRFATRRSTVLVRARDRAGNVSPWRSVPVRRARR